MRPLIALASLSMIVACDVAELPPIERERPDVVAPDGEADVVAPETEADVEADVEPEVEPDIEPETSEPDAVDDALAEVTPPRDACAETDARVIVEPMEDAWSTEPLVALGRDVYAAYVATGSVHVVRVSDAAVEAVAALGEGRDPSAVRHGDAIIYAYGTSELALATLGSSEHAHVSVLSPDGEARLASDGARLAALWPEQGHLMRAVAEHGPGGAWTTLDLGPVVDLRAYDVAFDGTRVVVAWADQSGTFVRVGDAPPFAFSTSAPLALAVHSGRVLLAADAPLGLYTLEGDAWHVKSAPVGGELIGLASSGHLLALAVRHADGATLALQTKGDRWLVRDVALDPTTVDVRLVLDDAHRIHLFERTATQLLARVVCDD